MATNWGAFYSQGSSYRPQKKKQTYTVKKKDNLWAIAQKYKTTPASILKRNKKLGRRLRPGQTLNIYEEVQTPEDNTFNQFQAEAVQQRQSRLSDRAYGTVSRLSSPFGTPSPLSSSIMREPVGGGGRSRAGTRPYQYTAEYGIVPPDVGVINTADVQRALDRGDMPIFITSYAAEALGLDHGLLAEWYDVGVTGNFIRRTQDQGAPAPIARGGGGGGGYGGYRRGGGGGGGGGGTARVGTTGFGGTPAAGYSGYRGPDRPQYGGVSPTGRTVRGASGLINWRI